MSCIDFLLSNLSMANDGRPWLLDTVIVNSGSLSDRIWAKSTYCWDQIFDLIFGGNVAPNGVAADQKCGSDDFGGLSHSPATIFFEDLANRILSCFIVTWFLWWGCWWRGRLLNVVLCASFVLPHPGFCWYWCDVPLVDHHVAQPALQNWLRSVVP